MSLFVMDCSSEIYSKTLVTRYHTICPSLNSNTRGSKCATRGQHVTAFCFWFSDRLVDTHRWDVQSSLNDKRSQNKIYLQSLETMNSCLKICCTLHELDSVSNQSFILYFHMVKEQFLVIVVEGGAD